MLWKCWGRPRLQGLPTPSELWLTLTLGYLSITPLSPGAAGKPARQWVHLRLAASQFRLSLVFVVSPGRAWSTSAVCSLCLDVRCQFCKTLGPYVSHCLFFLLASHLHMGHSLSLTFTLAFLPVCLSVAMFDILLSPLLAH